MTGPGSNIVDVACPLCKDNKCDLFFLDRRVEQLHNYKYLKCANCGLVYVSPRIDNRDYYTNSPDSYLASADLYTSLVSIPGFLYNLDLLEAFWFKRSGWLRRSRSSRGNLLEIGSAAGYFLDSARARGWITKGIEPATTLAKWSSRYLQLDIDNCCIEEANLNPASFDVVAAIDVIEHIWNPSEFLSRVKQLLKADGLLFLSTPNLDSNHWKIVEGVSQILEPNAHLTLFTRDTLKQILATNGFSEIKVEFIGMGDRDSHLVAYALKK